MARRNANKTGLPLTTAQRLGSLIKSARMKIGRGELRGRLSWYSLGTKLDVPATAEEAIVAAGLDYEVKLTTILTEVGTPVTHR